jgi:hypothetical protein
MEGRKFKIGIICIKNVIYISKVSIFSELQLRFTISINKNVGVGGLS